MPTNTEIKHSKDIDLAPIRILLVEADLAQVDRIVANIDREFQSGIRVVKTYDRLSESVLREKPQLVILGKIDNSSYSEIAGACHKVQKNLPIFLLSSQPIIIDSFRKLIKTCGLTDVVGRDSGDLNRLIRSIQADKHSLDRSMRQYLASEPLGNTGDLSSLTEPIANIPAQPIANIPAQPIATYTPKPIVIPGLEQPQIATQTILTALEEIVATSNNFFGPLAQGNYWRKAHDRLAATAPFLQNWSADHFGKISCDASISDRELTAAEIDVLRSWVHLFVEDCERVIIDYRLVLSNSNLSAPAKDLLPKI
jgi:hypothetical protein